MKLANLAEAKYHGTSMTLTVEVPEEALKELMIWMYKNNIKKSPIEIKKALENYSEGALLWDDLIEEHMHETEEWE